jgi:hypothetical protein
LGGKVKYMFQTTNPTIQPYAGAGLGLHILDLHGETPPMYFGGSLLFPGQSYDDTDVKLGLDLGADSRSTVATRSRSSPMHGSASSAT